MNAMPFLTLTFWMGILTILMVGASPFLFFHMARHEKNLTSRLIYGAVIIAVNAGMIMLFMDNIRRAGITLPTLIQFYADYLRNRPH